MPKKLLILVSVLLLALASCGGSDSGDEASNDGGDASVGAPDAANGEKVFSNTCVACHGQGGVGIDGLGKPMPGSTFIAGLSDDGLADFILVGRASDDPANTTGVDMPAKGGQDLSEQEVVDVVAYVRTLAE